MYKQLSRSLPGFLIIVIAVTFLFSHSASVHADEKPENPIKLHSHLMIMIADGTGLKLLFKSNKFSCLGSPVFSHDGKKIALDGLKLHLGESFGHTRILILNADGTGLKDLGSASMPSWSADDKQITFSSPKGGGVWIMDADGKNQEQLDARGWGSQWSPDGTKIIYSEGSIGGTNLKIYNTKEETFRYVFPIGKSPYSRYQWNMCWSPDSKSICVKGIISQHPYELVEKRLEGPKGITYKKVYEIATVDVEKGLESVKVHYSDATKQPGDDFSWHPDGKQILCLIQTPAPSRRRIFKFDSFSEEAPQIIHGQTFEGVPSSICWSPDGKKMIFTMVIVNK